MVFYSNDQVFMHLVSYDLKRYFFDLKQKNVHVYRKALWEYGEDNFIVCFI